MAVERNEYQPDYAVPPGWILEERLEAQGISQAELARRCGRSTKLISDIVAGKAAVEPETALQLEKVLGLDASIWLGIEKDYQLHEARLAEAREAEEHVDWIKGFPVKELVRRDAFAQPSSNADAVSKLLAFFKVASIEAWYNKYSAANVAYRHSPSFRSSETSVATWLRLGALEAEHQDCSRYNEKVFKEALQRIRQLTLAPVDEALLEIKRLFNDSGVAFAIVKPLPKTALSGAAWWLAPRKAMIQLSARHKSDDHLWFSLFHEAAHILLHSKKGVFVDGGDKSVNEIEAEANDWASRFLVSQRHWEEFIAAGPRSKREVLEFAESQGIAPGIVVGMLQHQRLIPWSHLNGLKVRYDWVD